MIIVCPHCEQQLESDVSFGKFDCPCCGNGFEIQYPRVPNRPPARSRWRSIIVNVIIVLVIAGIGLFFWTQPSRKTDNFKTEYAAFLKEKSKAPEALTIDWKVAGYDRWDEIFLGLCVICEKNSTGGYSDSRYIKVVGKTNDSHGTSFYPLELTLYEFPQFTNMSYDRFYRVEKTKAERLYHQLNIEIEKSIADGQKKAGLIDMPILSLSSIQETVFTPPSYEEIYDELVTESKHAQNRIREIEENNFYASLARYQIKEKTYQSLRQLNHFREAVKEKIVNVSENSSLQKQKEEEEAAKEEDRKHQEMIEKLKQEELEKEKTKQKNTARFKKPLEFELNKGKERPCLKCTGNGWIWSSLPGDKGRFKASCSVCSGMGVLSTETLEVFNTLKQPEPKLQSEKIRDDKPLIEEIQSLVNSISKIKNLKRHYYTSSGTHYAYEYGSIYSYTNEDERADEVREKKALKVARELKALGLHSKVYYPVRSIATKYTYSMNAKLRAKEVNRLADLAIEEIEKIIDSKKAELKNKKSLNEISK